MRALAIIWSALSAVGLLVVLSLIWAGAPPRLFGLWFIWGVVATVLLWLAAYLREEAQKREVSNIDDGLGGDFP